jgi:DNA-binding response OmpR family regulator
LNPALHIAIVDDEVDITDLLANYLRGQGYRVTALHNGRALMALMPLDPPALVLLDLGLPGEDGFSIARQLREHWRCGLVIVTGRGDAVDKIVGLEVGADDYVTKPFDLRELLARVKAVLRRVAPADGAPGLAAAAIGAGAIVVAGARVGAGAGVAAGVAAGVGAGVGAGVAMASGAGAAAATLASEPRIRHCFEGWALDRAARRLTDAGGRDVVLTTGEFDLLCTFVEHAGRVLSRDFLLEHTRGREAGPYDRTIDVQVGRLRKKLEADPENPQIIKSVRGAGYILVPAVSLA